MKKVEAPTLEEAYEKAAAQLSCSVTDLEVEVVQHPQKGILGFMKKEAIIVATCKENSRQAAKVKVKKVEVVKSQEKEPKVEKPKSATSQSKEKSSISEVAKSVKSESVKEKTVTKVTPSKTAQKDAVLESFFEKDGVYTDNTQNVEEIEEESVVYDELALMIEGQLKELLSHSCFDIDIVEVDVRDNTALIFIDGEDAALLIGKEGYRYNALSYMLFNWLHAKYELFIKLEIAEFLTSQQEMIRNYIKPVIENVQQHGKGKTRPLDGILVQIALEQLREVFPDKYVAVKTSREGKRFVVINEFNRR